MRKNNKESVEAFSLYRKKIGAPPLDHAEFCVAYADWLMQEDKRSLQERRDRFIDEVRPYVDDMGKDNANQFCKYWLQISPRGRKYKFEKEKTWDMKLRIGTWMRNQRNFSIAGILDKKYARDAEK